MVGSYGAICLVIRLLVCARVGSIRVHFVSERRTILFRRKILSKWWAVYPPNLPRKTLLSIELKLQNYCDGPTRGPFLVWLPADVLGQSWRTRRIRDLLPRALCRGGVSVVLRC